MQTWNPTVTGQPSPTSGGLRPIKTRKPTGKPTKKPSSSDDTSPDDDRWRPDDDRFWGPGRSGKSRKAPKSSKTSPISPPAEHLPEDENPPEYVAKSGKNYKNSSNTPGSTSKASKDSTPGSPSMSYGIKSVTGGKSGKESTTSTSLPSRFANPKPKAHKYDGGISKEGTTIKKVLVSEIANNNKKPKADKSSNSDQNELDEIIQMAPPALHHSKSGKSSKSSKKLGGEGSFSYASITTTISKSGKGSKKGGLDGNHSFSYVLAKTKSGKAKEGVSDDSSFSYDYIMAKASKSTPKAISDFIPEEEGNITGVGNAEEEERNTIIKPKANKSSGPHSQDDETIQMAPPEVAVSKVASTRVDVIINDIQESSLADEGVPVAVSNETNAIQVDSSRSATSSKAHKSSKVKYQTLSPTPQPSDEVEVQTSVSSKSSKSKSSKKNMSLPTSTSKKPKQSKSAKLNKQQTDEPAPGTPPNVNYSEGLADGISLAGYRQQTRDSDSQSATKQSSSASATMSVQYYVPRILMPIATVILFYCLV